MKKYYEMNKDRWFMWDDKGKKIEDRPWWEFYCPLHRKKHGKQR